MHVLHKAYHIGTRERTHMQTSNHIHNMIHMEFNQGLNTCVRDSESWERNFTRVSRYGRLWDGERALYRDDDIVKPCTPEIRLLRLLRSLDVGVKLINKDRIRNILVIDPRPQTDENPVVKNGKHWKWMFPFRWVYLRTLCREYIA